MIVATADELLLLESRSRMSLERRDVNRSHRHFRALPDATTGRGTDVNSAPTAAADGSVKTLPKGSTGEDTIVASKDWMMVAMLSLRASSREVTRFQVSFPFCLIRRPQRIAKKIC